MNAFNSVPSRNLQSAFRALVLSSLATAASPLLGADAPASTDKAAPSLDAAPGEFSNSVTVGVGSVFTDGDKAQFQRIQQLRSSTYGGLEELHYENSIGKKGSLSIDGHGIYNDNNYGLQFNLKHPEIGFLRAGYNEFRNYYDGSGGYSSTSNRWVHLYNDQFFLDRRQGFIEGGLTLPNWPTFTVKYTYDAREGLKDSTVWGDYNLTQNPKSAMLRGITPTWLGIDEERHILDFDVKHTLGNTTFGAGLRYELDEIDNTKNIVRRSGEPTLVRSVTQTEDIGTDFWNFHAFTETKLHPKALFSTGYSFTRLDTDLGGSRIYGPTYGSAFNPLYANRQTNDEGFYDLGGGSRVDQLVGNFNLMLTPWKHVTIVPSIRIEHQDQAGEALFTEFRAANTTNAVVLTDVLNTRIRRFTDVTGALAARYTGVTNWAFYARGEWLEGQGTLRENEFDVEDEHIGAVQIQRDTESRRHVQKYTTGANWYPHRKVNAAAQYYFRIRENEYDHDSDSASFPTSPGNLYPAFIRNHEFDTHDVNFRVTYRPIPKITLVSRYDLQFTGYNTHAGTNNLGIALNDIQSAKMTSHILSQSASWSPLPQLYFQTSISYAFQNTESPVTDTTGAGANLVQAAENDYWNGTFTMGAVLSERSDLQTQYVYYRADNFADNSAVSVPYGAGAEQHGVTVTLINRLRKDLLWKVQYGFFTGHDQTYGGNNDFTSHLVYTSMQYLF